MPVPPPLSPDSPSFIAGETQMYGGDARPQSVRTAVGCALAAVAIGLLGKLYFYVIYSSHITRPMSQEQQWWNIYSWAVLMITFAAGLGAWSRNRLAFLALTLVLLVSLGVQAWMTLKTLTVYPQAFLMWGNLINFALFNLLPGALKIVALAFITLTSSRSWIYRFGR